MKTKLNKDWIGCGVPKDPEGMVRFADAVVADTPRNADMAGVIARIDRIAASIEIGGLEYWMSDKAAIDGEELVKALDSLSPTGAALQIDKKTKVLRYKKV